MMGACGLRDNFPEAPQWRLILDDDDEKKKKKSSRRTVGCRHGRVLVIDSLHKVLIVIAPITGTKLCVPFPPKLKGDSFITGTVLCAAADHDHVHGSCHLSPGPAVLEHQRGGDYILRFDLDGHNLAVIRAPPITNDVCYHNGSHQIIQAVDGAVGLAILSDNGHTIQMWQKEVNSQSVNKWLLWQTIEMHNIHGLHAQIEGKKARLTIFISCVCIWAQPLLVDVMELKCCMSNIWQSMLVLTNCIPGSCSRFFLKRQMLDWQIAHGAKPSANVKAQRFLFWVTYWQYTLLVVHILEFDLDGQSLPMIEGRLVVNDLRNASRKIMPADNGDVGLAILSYPHFQMWKRDINYHGVMTWVLHKTIDISIILGLPP
uniref:Uncharacterized protein n=1 Tax=Aegilops tauschii TaxID=37682 RepID=M8CDI6_AEGTA